MPVTSTRNSIARGALILGSLALVALVAELGLRVTWTEPWWEKLQADPTEPELDRFPVGRFQLPLRKPPEAEPKPDGTYRILVLGDSFTYAQGVDEELGFVRRLETMLNARRPLPGIERYEVYNGGIPGSLTPAWHALLAHLGGHYQPDQVLAVFFLRDGVAGVKTADQIDGIRQQMRRIAQTSAAYRRSYLVRFALDRIERQRLSSRYLERIRMAYVGPDADRGEWWRARTELLWMRRESERLGARFALAVFPMLYELGDDYPLAEVCDAIEGFAHEHEIPVFSLLPSFRGRDAPDLWVSAYDQHPNSEGHRIAAEALYPFVVSQLAE